MLPSYTRNTPDSGPGCAKPRTSFLMMFSGLSLPSNRPRMIGTGCRPQRLADRYGAAPIDPTEGRCLGGISRGLATPVPTRYSDKIIPRFTLI